ncbi:hypothetical protein KPL71_002130 [Citrus sinensis]|uniref:Uncharacterized protein n=1 Tax=Citrus sinensis TaxID=2711 RepID=A0ACB8P2X4_CITSI|nr:hypothetical protein KPL71_002130 [Citrus sinensis]
MKQKIVIKVQITCKKCRRKAMKIAVKADGVIKVEIKGEGKDELVVIGNEVDSVKLTRKLQKKLGFASLLSVQEEKDGKEKEKEKESKEIKLTPIEWAYYCQCPPPYHQFVVDSNPSPNCFIL